MQAQRAPRGLAPRRIRALLIAVAAVLAQPGPAAAQTQAPALRADGQTLRWEQVASATRYVLATKKPGSATAYRRYLRGNARVWHRLAARWSGVSSEPGRA